MPTGYWGKILVVDLTTGTCEVEAIPDEIYRQFVGGYGLAARLLYERIPPGADALGPENVLAFMPGLLTGTGAPFSGRFMVAAKSPLTGGWGDANAGGSFGPALPGAGYDGVLVRGTAPQPVYLYVDAEHTELRDARGLWGRDTADTEQAIISQTLPDVRVACIGPAGERLSLISGVVNDGGRIAARCGLGAVMGAKRLKAVAARGKQSAPVADKAAYAASAAEYRQLFRRRPARFMSLLPWLMRVFGPLMSRLHLQISGGPAQMVIDNFRLYGTASATALLVAMGDTPVRNWGGQSPDDYSVDQAACLSDEAVVRDNIRAYACHSCPVACGAMIRLPDGGSGHRPEYETLAVFGPTLLNADLPTVVACNEICNLAGLDTIATGVAIAFAMDCQERGWLPADLAGEMKLSWGYGPAIVELTRRIADRRAGLGEWLADGVHRAASRLAPEAQAVAMHAGGQALPMHRSLYDPSLGVAYLTDPAPGRHTAIPLMPGSVMAPYLRAAGQTRAGRYDWSAKGTEAAVTMPILRVIDSLGLCQFCLTMGSPPFLSWLNAATGWDWDEAELLRAGRSIQVMRHAFNARHGVVPASVTLPGRERGEPPHKTGPTAGITLDTTAMTTSYYATLGVDPMTNWPRPATVRELNLGTLFEPLEGV